METMNLNYRLETTEERDIFHQQNLNFRCLLVPISVK